MREGNSHLVARGRGTEGKTNGGKETAGSGVGRLGYQYDN